MLGYLEKGLIRPKTTVVGDSLNKGSACRNVLRQRHIYSGTQSEEPESEPHKKGPKHTARDPHHMKWILKTAQDISSGDLPQ